MRISNLIPTTNQKSFNGKALIIGHDNGKIELQSYDTIVATYENGTLKVHGKYSQTTSKHIKAFTEYLGLPTNNMHVYL